MPVANQCAQKQFIGHSVAHCSKYVWMHRYIVVVILLGAVLSVVPRKLHSSHVPSLVALEIALDFHNCNALLLLFWPQNSGRQVFETVWKCLRSLSETWSQRGKANSSSKMVKCSVSVLCNQMELNEVNIFTLFQCCSFQTFFVSAFIITFCLSCRRREM